MSGASSDAASRRRLSGVERRRVILDSGMRIFAELGYERASMRAIARAAGVTTPVVYDHFPSKRELHVALLDEQEAALRAHQSRERELEPGPELMRALLDDFFSWVEAHPDAWRMLFLDTPTDPEVRVAQRHAQQRSIAQILSFAALRPGSGETAGLDREAVDLLLARSVYAVGNELAAWWLNHPDVPRHRIVGFAYDLLWPGLARVAGLNTDPEPPT